MAFPSSRNVPAAPNDDEMIPDATDILGLCPSKSCGAPNYL